MGVCSKLDAVREQRQFYERLSQQVLSLRRRDSQENKLIGTEMADAYFGQGRGCLITCGLAR